MGNLEGETESLLIEAQNIDGGTNYIKAKIDNTQQNNKCRLYGDSDKTVNHIISVYCELTQQKCNTKHVQNVVHWESCRRLKLDPITKWSIHKPESISENKTHTIVLDFKIQRNLPRVN